MVARWGAQPVIWLLGFENSQRADQAARWQKVGRRVFGEQKHGPVLFYVGQAPGLFGELRDQSWVDGIEFLALPKTSGAALPKPAVDVFAHSRTNEPLRPLIPFCPAESGLSPAAERINPDDQRRSAYWSSLSVPPAGVSYSTDGIVDWNSAREVATGHQADSGWPRWKKVLYAPAAAQVSYLATLLNSVSFWELRPQPNAVASRPGVEGGGRCAAAGTEARDTLLVYVPEERAVTVRLEAMPASASVTWYNPRTGQSTAAAGVVGDRTCQFPTPGPGDWLLLMTKGKR
jgi:hypothetical protein